MLKMISQLTCEQITEDMDKYYLKGSAWLKFHSYTLQKEVDWHTGLGVVLFENKKGPTLTFKTTMYRNLEICQSP